MFDDAITVDTPEGVRLELTLAGLGTRIVATMVDSIIQGVLVAIAAFGMVAIGNDVTPDTSLQFLGGLSTVALIVVVGYPVAFETLNSGRTPGKAATGIRVILSSGSPVGLWSSTIRNLFRLVDFLPAAYTAGAFSILASEMNQRLGDMAASTVVVRYRFPIRASMSVGEAATGWDVSAVTTDEVILVRRFFDRSRSLPIDRRQQLAKQIATRLRAKVGGMDTVLDDVEFLRKLLGEKLSR